MNLMVNPVITDFQQDVNGDIKMLKLGANKEDAWANIAEQGASAKLDNNKAATINVSTYTEPVVINPTSGKDGMKKATITLSNIPSPSSNTTAYAWELGVYLPFSVAPATMTQSEIENQLCFYIKPAKTGFESATVITFGDYLAEKVGEYTSLAYAKVSDIKFTITATVGGEDTPYTFELVSEDNFTLWQENE